MRVIARWETTGADYLELVAEGDRLGEQESYVYRGRNCGGVLGLLPSDAVAVWRMEEPGRGPVAILKSDRPSLRRVR